MIGRRQALAVLAGAALPICSALAQSTPGRVPRLAILSLGSSEARPVFAALRKGLRDLGHTEGVTIALEFHFADGDHDRLKSLAQAIVRTEPAVILADGGFAATAMQAETRSIPIVAVGSIDPALRPVAASFSRPGGNVTGIATFAIEVAIKQLEVLLQIAPTARRIGVLGLQADAARQALAEIASVRGLELRHIQIATRAEAEQVLTADALAGLDGVIVAQNPVTSALSDIVVARINASGKPAVYVEREFLTAGGLASYGVDFVDIFHRLASFIDRILKGAKPSDIPIEQPTRLTLIINLGTARALGLDVPLSILSRADEVIE